MINYFELGYFEAAFSQAETFRQFVIKNKQLSGGRKEKCSNFLKFYLVLLRKKSGMQSNASVFYNELTECTMIRNKDWLKEKFKELS